MIDPREVIAGRVGGLRIDAIEQLGEGWDHVAYLVNEELVFRLPWELLEETEATEVARSAEAEVRLLRTVDGRIPVAVPRPVHVADDGSFFGYRYIPGRAVADALDLWVDPRRQDALVRLVVEVAVAIEAAVPVEDACATGLEVLGEPRHAVSGAEAALEAALLPADARPAAEAALASYETLWEEAASRKMATLHADFGLDHWLLDQRGEIHALIDWSDACVAPPEHQLSTLMWDIPTLVAPAAARYAESAGSEVDLRLVVADGYLNALGDLAELLEEEVPADDEDVARCVRFLETWAPEATRSLGR